MALDERITFRANHDDRANIQAIKDHARRSLGVDLNDSQAIRAALKRFRKEAS